MTPIMSSLGSSSAHCGRVPDRGCLRWLCSGRASCQGRVRGSGVVGCGWGGEAAWRCHPCGCYLGDICGGGGRGVITNSPRSRVVSAVVNPGGG
jgi:hypothetical protein